MDAPSGTAHNGAVYPRGPRRQWTHEEDIRLLRIVQEYDFSTLQNHWVEIAERFGGKRNLKQCRDRYIHHLHYVTKTPFTIWEEFHLFTLQAHIGNKWCDIALQLPGRTESGVKNRWYSALRRVQRVGMCSPEAAALIIGQYSLYAAKTPPIGYDEWFAWSQLVLSGKLPPDDVFEYPPRRNSLLSSLLPSNPSSSSSSTGTDDASTVTETTINNPSAEASASSSSTTTTTTTSSSSSSTDPNLMDNNDPFNPYAQRITNNGQTLSNLPIRKIQFEDPLLLRLETFVGNRRPLKDFFEDPRYAQLMRLEAETSHLGHDPVHRRARRRRLRTTALTQADTNDADGDSDYSGLSGGEDHEHSFNDSTISQYPRSSTTSTPSHTNKSNTDTTNEETYYPTEFRSKRGRKMKPKVCDDYVNPDEYIDDTSITSPHQHTSTMSSSVSKSMFYHADPKPITYNEGSSGNLYSSSSSFPSNNYHHNNDNNNNNNNNSSSSNTSNSSYESLPFSVLPSNTNSTLSSHQQPSSSSSSSYATSGSHSFTGNTHGNNENLSSLSSSSSVDMSNTNALFTNPTYDNTTRNSNTLMIPPSMVHMPSTNKNNMNGNNNTNGMASSSLTSNNQNNNNSSSGGGGGGTNDINLPPMNHPMNMPMNFPMNHPMHPMNSAMMNPMNSAMMNPMGWNNSNALMHNGQNNHPNDNTIPQALLSMQQQYFMQQQLLQQQFLQQQMFLRQQQQQQQQNASVTPFGMMGGIPSMFNTPSPFMNPGMMPNNPHPMMMPSSTAMNNTLPNGSYNNFNMPTNGMFTNSNQGSNGNNPIMMNNNNLNGSNNFIPSSIGIPLNALSHSSLNNNSNNSNASVPMLMMNMNNGHNNSMMTMMQQHNNSIGSNPLPMNNNNNPSGSIHTTLASSSSSSSSSSEELLPFEVSAVTNDTMVPSSSTSMSGQTVPSSGNGSSLLPFIHSSSTNTLSVSGSYDTTSLVSSSSSNPLSPISLMNNNSNPNNERMTEAAADFAVFVTGGDSTGDSRTTLSSTKNEENDNNTSVNV